MITLPWDKLLQMAIQLSNTQISLQSNYLFENQSKYFSALFIPINSIPCLDCFKYKPFPNLAVKSEYK